MKCVIIIDGESANALFAVGGKDLAQHFLPQGLYVKTSDIVRIQFEELRRDGKIISLAEAVLDGRPYEVIKSKDEWNRNSVVENGINKP